MTSRSVACAAPSDAAIRPISSRSAASGATVRSPAAMPSSDRCTERTVRTRRRTTQRSAPRPPTMPTARRSTDGEAPTGIRAVGAARSAASSDCATFSACSGSTTAVVCGRICSWKKTP